MTRRPLPKQATPQKPAAAPRRGALTPEAEARVASMLAKLRGQKRATIADRLAAARWLLEAGYGPPPEGDPAQFDESDDDVGEEHAR